MLPSLKELASIFSSYTKAQEMLFLLHDLKPVVRQGFYEKELPPIELFCKEHALHLVKSSFKVLLADTSDYTDTGEYFNNSEYSNKGLRLPLHDKREGMFFIYLSKDEKSAWLAAYYELMNNHRELGLLLGYPECCVEFFCRNFNENKTDLQLNPTNPYTNITKRKEDAVLLSHFPCQVDCLESVRLAKQYLTLLHQHEPARAEELWKVLGG